MPSGPATSPATGSIHDRCLQDLALVFQSLDFQGATQKSNVGGNVNCYVKSLADDLTDVTFPAILVCTESGEEMLEQENFEERVWGYPCACLLMDAQSTIDPNARPDFLEWRHQMMVALDELPVEKVHPFLPSTPECWNITLRPRSIFEEWQRTGKGGEPAGAPTIVTSFVALCHTNEKRKRS